MKKKWLILLVAVLLVAVAAFVVIKTTRNRVLAYEDAADTYADLQTALQGEVTATEKYVQFAAVAKAEGNTSIERLFLAAAAAERIHIDKEYRIANAMKACVQPAPNEFAIGASAENLQSCIEGELYESETMYPTFLETAQKNNYPLAEKTFRYARDAEASHAVLFADALSLLQESGSGQTDEVYYICPVCGKLEKGSASAFCPVCGTPGLMFEKF